MYLLLYNYLQEYEVVTVSKLVYEYKKVWNKKDNKILEYQEWFIFTFIINEPIKSKISSLIDQEINRFKENNIPLPRITKLNHKTASSFNFSTFSDKNNFFYTTKVSGSLQENDLTYNSYLQREIINYDYISFKPEIIINVHYIDGKEDYYLYQFNEKQKSYDTFGTTLKYHPANLKPYTTQLNIIAPNKNDDALIIPTQNFSSFIKAFQKDMLTAKYHLFEDPNKIIKKCLFEQLSNFNNLITEQDIELLVKI